MSQLCLLSNPRHGRRGAPSRCRDVCAALIELEQHHDAMIAPLVCFSDCKQAKQKTTQLFRSIVFGSRHLSDCCTMPPKVKSKSAALAIEAMASKPDKPSDVQQRKPEDDASPLPAVARKVKGAKTAKATSKANQAPMTKKKQGRPTFACIGFEAHVAISDACGIVRHRRNSYAKRMIFAHAKIYRNRDSHRTRHQRPHPKVPGPLCP